jgi:hypothetical protein
MQGEQEKNAGAGFNAVAEAADDSGSRSEQQASN